MAKQVGRKQLGTDDLIRVKGMKVRIKNIEREAKYHFVWYQLPDGTKRTLALGPNDKVTRYDE